MKLFAFTSLLLIGLGFASAQSDVNDNTTTTTSTPTTTTTTPTTTTTTPTTTTTATTTTTTTPTTTTTTPTTTTTATTTTSATPTTTTSPPIPKPTPMPAVETGRWMLNETGKGNCLLMNMGLEVLIDYKSTRVNKTQTGKIVLPKAANLTGVCPQNEPQFSVSLNWTDPSNRPNSIQMTFLKNYTLADEENTDTEKLWSISQMVLNFYWDNKTFPDNPSQNQSVAVTIEKNPFEATANHSYKCITAQNIKVGGTETSPNASFVFNSVQIEAFRDPAAPPAKQSKFSQADVCDLDREISDVVPIAVGVSLAALVIIVIIAYIVGRQRSRQRGYQTV